MGKHFLYIISLSVLIASCSKDTEKVEEEILGNGLATEGTVSGTLFKDGDPIEITGNYIISDGHFKITSPMGNMGGPVEKTDNFFRITFDNGTGLYEDILEGLTGEIESTNSDIENLMFDSSYITGSADLTSYLYLQSLDLRKSMIYFAHDLIGREARIELNDAYGQSLEPLCHYYETANRGDSTDFCHRANGILNSDYFTSKIFTWRDQTWPYDDDNPYAFLAGFVVDKETFIDYKVYWDNGHIENGRIFSDIGGSVKHLCVGSEAGGFQLVDAFYEYEYKHYTSTVFFDYLSRSGCTAGKMCLTMSLEEDFHISVVDFSTEPGLQHFTGLSACQPGLSADISFPSGETYIVDSGYIIVDYTDNVEFRFKFERYGNTHEIRGEGTYLRHLNP